MGNNSEPLVTVIMCTYRRPRLLRRVINSVLNQTYPHFKLCIYDDASGDETPEVVAEFVKKDARVVYQCHEKNLGVFYNQLYGIDRVETPFFALCADDDVFLPQHLEFAMQGFQQHPQAGVVCNQTICIDAGRVMQVSMLGCRPGLYNSIEGVKLLLSNGSVLITYGVMRTQIFSQGVSLDPDTGLLLDWDFSFQVAAQFPIVLTQKLGIIFVPHACSYVTSIFNGFQWPQWLKMYRKLRDHPLLDSDTKKAVEFHLKNRLRSLLVNQGKQAILEKDYLTARLAAETVKDFFKSKRLYLKLTLLATLCKYFPPLRWYLKLYGSLRRRKKLFKARNRFLEYQQYTAYLKD
jgi:glycosyltransferase involved in cell wall biosynthesis